MSISLPTINLPQTPRAIFDIMRLEAGPAALPTSQRVLALSAVAYAVGETADQLVNQNILPSIIYGVISLALLALFTFVALLLAGARDRVAQTLNALMIIGAAVAIVSVALHLFVGEVFPPPMPTAKLVGFVLFPLVLWKVTLYMWIYRHGSLRFIPALAVSVVYVGLTHFIMAPIIARICERL